MYGNPFHLVLVFDHYSILAEDVLPQIVYVIITLETATPDTPNKVVVLATDTPAKSTPTIDPLWKSEKPPILQYIHTNCY